jgi:hypothetical protein
MVACEEDADRRVNTSNPIRILVVDDHPLRREGIAVLVGGQPDMKVVADAIIAIRGEFPDGWSLGCAS